MGIQRGASSGWRSGGSEKPGMGRESPWSGRVSPAGERGSGLGEGEGAGDGEQLVVVLGGEDERVAGGVGGVGLDRERGAGGDAERGGQGGVAVAEDDDVAGGDLADGDGEADRLGAAEDAEPGGDDAGGAQGCGVGRGEEDEGEGGGALEGAVEERQRQQAEVGLEGDGVAGDLEGGGGADGGERRGVGGLLGGEGAAAGELEGELVVADEDLGRDGDAEEGEVAVGLGGCRGGDDGQQRVVEAQLERGAVRREAAVEAVGEIEGGGARKLGVREGEVDAVVGVRTAQRGGALDAHVLERDLGAGLAEGLGGGWAGVSAGVWAARRPAPSRTASRRVAATALDVLVSCLD